MKYTRPSMEECYMLFAHTLSKRSTCSRLSVGAVITSLDYEVVYGIGYNGGAKGQRNACDSLKPGLCGHLHAEINALIKCSTRDKKKVMFVTTIPCKMCAKAIVNSGFSKVFYTYDYRNDDAMMILAKAGISLNQLKVNV